MKTKFLNLSAVVIMVVALLSIGFFSACEEKDGNNEKSSYLYGVWKCTDYRYNQEGYLKLTFNNNSTLSAENTTLQESLFDNLINGSYEIKSDSIIYIMLDNTSPMEFILYQISSNAIKLFFTGGIIQDANAPSGIYEFKKEGGEK